MDIFWTEAAKKVGGNAHNFYVYTDPKPYGQSPGRYFRDSSASNSASLSDIARVFEGTQPGARLIGSPTQLKSPVAELQGAQKSEVLELQVEGKQEDVAATAARLSELFRGIVVVRRERIARPLTQGNPAALREALRSEFN